MALGDELSIEIRGIFREQWALRDGRVVPETKAVGENNDGVRLEATVLYADLSGSTSLVDNLGHWRAAEVYKAFLRCSARVIRSEGGEIRAYDGDRVMGIFLGDSKNRSASRAALKINYAVKNIVQPAYDDAYPNTPYTIRHCVGIDTSELMAVRAGIRGSNDIAWIGRAANYAAKLTSLPHTHASRITAAVYTRLADREKFGSAENKPMWEEVSWTPMNNARIYRSTWWWKV